jgi:hypothetical protein
MPVAFRTKVTILEICGVGWAKLENKKVYK